MTDPELHAIFTGALRELGENGEHWGKGSYSFKGTYCLMGACFSTYPSHYMGSGVRPILSECIREVAPLIDSQFSEESFNDRAETTFPDIARVLACAIRKTAP